MAEMGWAGRAPRMCSPHGEHQDETFGDTTHGLSTARSQQSETQPAASPSPCGSCYFYLTPRLLRGLISSCLRGGKGSEECFLKTCKLSGDLYGAYSKQPLLPYGSAERPVARPHAAPAALPGHGAMHAAGAGLERSIPGPCVPGAGVEPLQPPPCPRELR